MSSQMDIAHSKLVEGLTNMNQFTLLVDKNKINEEAIDDYGKCGHKLRYNLPEFKDQNSKMIELFKNGNMKDYMIRDFANLLTVYGLKFKYLNRKKMFSSAKLSKDALRLKKTFVCLEICKVYEMLKWIEIAQSSKMKIIKTDCKTFKEKIYFEVEKIAKHFEETWKISEDLDDIYTIAACKLSQIYMAIGKKSKAMVYVKKLTQSVKSYIEKPSLISDPRYLFVELVPDSNSIQHMERYQYEKKWSKEMISEIYCVFSKFHPKNLKPNGQMAFLKVTSALQFYEMMNHKEKLAENSKFISGFVRNQMLPQPKTRLAASDKGA